MKMHKYNAQNVTPNVTTYVHVSKTVVLTGKNAKQKPKTHVTCYDQARQISRQLDKP